MELDWREMPSLSSLRAFQMTAQRGSFAAAARRLNVTQAAVAQQVRSLEAELGLRLTERAGRSIQLTAAGFRLAEALADGFGRIAAGVTAAREGEAGRGLRVSATPGIASKVLLPKLADFWSEHPEIAVTIVPDRRSVDLVAEGFDLAIRADELDSQSSDADTDADILIESEIIAVGAPSYFADGPPDPKNVPWLTRDTYELTLLRRAGYDPDALTFQNIGPPSLEPAAARMGYGIMMCPEIMVRQDLSCGDLRRVPMPELGVMAYHAVTPKGPKRAAVQAYVAWLQRLFSA